MHGQILKIGEQQKNSLKITSGLFAGTFKQTISRLTWELPQTIMGFTYAYTMNNLNLVKNVDQYRGATVTTLKTSKGAVTLGSYITGNKDLKAEVGNSILCTNMVTTCKIKMPDIIIY